jgi:hypothetical protein
MTNHVVCRRFLHAALISTRRSPPGRTGDRYEVYDGIVVYVAPSDEPEGRARSRIVALAEAHAAPAFDVACDMLNRCSETTDIAPHVSVFPMAP